MRPLLASRPATRALLASVLVPAALAAQQPVATRGARPIAPEAALSAGLLSASFERTVARVSPSVVQVVADAMVMDERDDGIPHRATSSGSGVVVDATGLIVTNAHVVAGARTVTVVLPSEEGRAVRLPARLVGADRETDLALLKVDTTGLRPLAFAVDATPHPGTVVLAFGAPLGLANSVTMGIVSAVDRELDPASPIGYLQTDAPINPGNSGGPLVDPSGEVLGLNTLILSRSGGSEGIGLAIPAPVVAHVVAQLRTQGRVHRGVIGVTVQPVTAAVGEYLGLARPGGLLVADVTDGSPAEAAGIGIGDVLLSVDGTAIGSVRRFATALYHHHANQLVDLVVWHEGKAVSKRVPLADEPDDPESIGLNVDPEANRVTGLGVIAATLDSASASRIPSLRYGPGVLVAAVVDQADDAMARFEPGDVIHAVNGDVIATLEGLRRRIAGAPAGAPLLVWVEREGRGCFVATRRAAAP